MDQACFFGRFARDDCHGPIDPCHIVSQQVIKREWQLANPRSKPAWHEATGLTKTKLKEVLSDQRNIVFSCRYHHANADLGWIEYEVPQSAREFAKQYGLERFLAPIKERA